jgi:hypothetical protein
MADAASGDLGLMHLERGDFIQAMDILLKAGLWEDASFVAERILTADELKAYVDQQAAPSPTAKPATADGASPASGTETNSPDDFTSRLRNLLGRRLVREDRYSEAAAYLASPYDKIVQKYSAALKDGANTNLPKQQRAQAFFTAAWLARYDGMELMGTEVAPDSFTSSGEFVDADLAQERLAGEHSDETFSNGQEKTSKAKNSVPTSSAEIQRLKRNALEPDKRYHYRFIAAALAMRAAALLPDNTEELADVVNTAGGWIKNSDEKLGDRYFQVIDQRCAKTRIGTQASASHWFVDTPGPWSTAQQAAYDAMHKEYGDTKPQGQ